jgi:hypothetical protein
LPPHCPPIWALIGQLIVVYCVSPSLTLVQQFASCLRRHLHAHIYTVAIVPRMRNNCSIQQLEQIAAPKLEKEIQISEGNFIQKNHFSLTDPVTQPMPPSSKALHLQTTPTKLRPEARTHARTHTHTHTHTHKNNNNNNVVHRGPYVSLRVESVSCVRAAFFSLRAACPACTAAVAASRLALSSSFSFASWARRWVMLLTTSSAFLSLSRSASCPPEIHN